MGLSFAMLYELLMKIYENYSKILSFRQPLGLSKGAPQDHFWTLQRMVSYSRDNGSGKEEITEDLQIRFLAEVQS